MLPVETLVPSPGNPSGAAAGSATGIHILHHHLAEYAAMLRPAMRIPSRIEKYVLHKAMKGLLPGTLYKREKFAFMAPPAHTDPKKWRAMQALASRYLNPNTLDEVGLLDAEGVAALFELHEASTTSAATQTQLDAVINHLIGVQALHQRFIASDIPAQARRKAEELGWQATHSYTELKHEHHYTGG